MHLCHHEGVFELCELQRVLGFVQDREERNRETYQAWSWLIIALFRMLRLHRRCFKHIFPVPIVCKDCAGV